MDNEIAITPEKIKFKIDSIANVRTITFGYTIEKNPILLEITNKLDVTVLKVDVYKNYTGSVITKIKEAVIAMDKNLRELLLEKNIFLFSFPENEEKFIGCCVIWKTDGKEIKTRIIGYNSLLDMFQLENFLFMVPSNEVYIDNVCVSDMLIYG